MIMIHYFLATNEQRESLLIENFYVRMHYYAVASSIDYYI